MSCPCKLLHERYLQQSGSKGLSVEDGSWRQQLFPGPTGGPLLYEGIRLAMNSKVLNGSQRVVMDGVLSNDECRELLRLTNVSATTLSPAYMLSILCPCVDPIVPTYWPYTCTSPINVPKPWVSYGPHTWYPPCDTSTLSTQLPLSLCRHPNLPCPGPHRS